MAPGDEGKKGGSGSAALAGNDSKKCDRETCDAQMAVMGESRGQRGKGVVACSLELGGGRKRGIKTDKLRSTPASLSLLHLSHPGPGDE